MAIPSALLYRFDRARNKASVWISHAAELAALVGFIVVMGIGSSWYMIDVGSPFTTRRNGPWVQWMHVAVKETDPYTKAHIARLGSIPLSANVSATFEARTDSDGQRLHSSCEYVVEAPALAANWWSLAVYDDNGLLIPNAAERHAFTSDTVAYNPDGTFYVSMGRDARPGNWLPVGGAGRLTLVLELIEPARASNAGQSDIAAPRLALPVIRRTACR